MKCFLIRHGATKGNREGRYVGSTEESVLPGELTKLEKFGRRLPQMDHIFSSPYLRCRQSARALFQDQDVLQELEIIPDFREMDFGAFEYHNYQELNGNPDYQRFIDSGGKTAFPGGEQLQDFKQRCCQAFLNCLWQSREQNWQTLGFVLHGGTIMAIMERWAVPKREYFEYQVKNGCGYQIEIVFLEQDDGKEIIFLGKSCKIAFTFQEKGY